MKNKSPISSETRRRIVEKMRLLLKTPSRRLPTDRELAEEFSASYATIRLVMKQLEREGFIQRVRGSGTYLKAGAARLLDAEALRKLWFFHSPIVGSPETDFSSWFMQEIRELAKRIAAWFKEEHKRHMKRGTFRELKRKAA